MSTIITADNGVEFEVRSLGVVVVDHVEQEAIWARLSDAQRVELAAALDPGRRGLHVRLDNQAKTLATFQRERDEALDWAKRAEDARDTAATRAEQVEKKLAKVMSDYQDLEDETRPAVSRADVAEALGRCLNPEMWNVTFPAVVNEICDLFGVGAEQAVDPVEDKARELHQVASPAPYWTWGALEEHAKDPYRRIARHVLGQEASGDE